MTWDKHFQMRARNLPDEPATAHGMAEAIARRDQGRKSWSPFEMLSLCVALAAFSGFYALSLGRVLDDSYITYRFAKHLSEGHGFVWNVGGEFTEGFTSLLHVLLCAAAGTIGWDFLPFTRGLSLTSLVLCLLICLLWIKSAGISRAWTRSMVYILFLSNGCLVFASLFGMETLISALLLTVLSFLWWLWSEQRLSWPRIGILATISLLCVMCRPDFLLWIGVASVTAMTLEVRRWVHDTAGGKSVALLGVTCLAMVLPAFVYMIVKYILFGMRLPNPYYVKSASSVIAYSGLKYVVAYLLWVFPLLLGMCIGVLHARSLRWISQFTATSLYIAIFVRFEPLMGTAFRFLLPVFPTMVALGLVGLQSGVSRARRPWPVKSRYLRLASVSGIVLWLCVWSLSSYLHVKRAVANQNTRNYQRIGMALAEVCDESGMIPTLATGDQGALPFYSGWNALDFVGLTNNRIARMKDGAEVADYVIGEAPDLVVVRRLCGDRHSGKLFVAHGVPGTGDAMVKNPVFQHDYAEIGSVPDEDGDRIVFFVDRQSRWAGATTAALLKSLADIAGAETAGTYSSGGGMHD